MCMFVWVGKGSKPGTVSKGKAELELKPKTQEEFEN